MYVLLTARQPFSSPKTHDPMEVRGQGQASKRDLDCCCLARDCCDVMCLLTPRLPALPSFASFAFL